jgi:hypothetical protein
MTESPHVKETMFYGIADCLGIGLHEMPDGRVRGMESKKIKIGPWTVDADVIITGDIKKPTEVSFFVKVLGNLWLYMIEDKNGLRTVVFDASIVKMHVKDCAGFGGKSIADTLKKLKPGTVTIYRYVHAAHKWVENEASSNPMHEPGLQSPVLLIAGPQASA